VQGINPNIYAAIEMIQIQTSFLQPDPMELKWSGTPAMSMAEGADPQQHRVAE
jgi:hypothetical protein